MTSFLLQIAIGLAAGILSGLFGIGGGVVIVPALVLLMGYSQVSASGTSLVALLAPVGILGVWQYYAAGKIGVPEIKTGLFIALGLVFGVLGGAKIATSISDQTLRKAFAVFLAAIAIRIWWK